jgi:hypothetical protein
VTICVSVKVAEGLVLAADSAVTLSGTITTPQGAQTAIIQTFEYANKVTQIKDYPVGTMSWGIGSIGDRSIQSLVMEHDHGLPLRTDNKEFTVRGLADGLIGFITARYESAYGEVSNKPLLGFLVGGYSHGSFFAEEYQAEFPDPTLQVRRPDRPDRRPSFGADWFGQVDALTRLIKGYDGRTLDELVNRGADKEIVQKWVDDQVSELPLVFDGMPLQDAIEFAEYAVQVVIGRYRFGAGTPLCGGDVDIAVITPTSFKWAQRKQWAIKGGE